MMWRGHVLLGTAVAFSSAAVVDLPREQGWVWVPIVVLTSLWPDLDGEGARLARLLPPVTTLLSWLTRRLAKASYSAVKGPRDAVEPRIHRGLSHTPVYILACSLTLFGLLSAWLPSYALLVSSAFCVGNLAHLLGDAFSLSGLPLLWPLKIREKRWYDVKAPKIIRFRVGDTVETVLLTPLMLLLAIFSAVWYMSTLWG